MANRDVWSWESAPSTRTLLYDQYGGYNTSIVQDVNESKLDEYICNLCTKILRDPELTKCCGHHYCKSCLEQWLMKQETLNSCPHCRNDPFEHFPDLKIERTINAIKAHCLHKDEGCNWEGELGTLELHLDSKTECDYVPIPCPDHCDLLVKRKDFSAHKRECIMVVTECPFKRYGCTARVQRKNLEDHSKQEVHNHLFLFMEPYQNLESRVTKLNIDFTQVNKRIQELTGKVNNNINGLNNNTKRLNNETKRLNRNIDIDEDRVIINLLILYCVIVIIFVWLILITWKSFY